MAEDLKLLGKLGLDLTKLKQDITTLESLINKANKDSKQLGSAWKNVADEMKKAFKGFPLTEYTKALAKFEEAQKYSLDKQKQDKEKFQKAEVRREEKHQSTMTNQTKIYNQRLSEMQEKQKLKMAQMVDRYNSKEVQSTTKHMSTIQRLYAKMQGSGFSKRLGSLFDYTMASGALYGTARAFTEVIKSNKSFEVEQMNLQRILKATTSEMGQLKDMTFEVGKATGNTANDVQTIENLWVRTGKVGKENMQALQDIVNTTSIGLNTTQFESADEAVSKLNAAVNQMAGGDLKYAQEILDSWAKTADYTAVGSARDLAEVMSRAGSGAKSLGMDFHDLNAVSGILAERMAIDGERIGTSLKSVFTRFQNPANIKVVEKWGVQMTEVGAGGKETFRNFTDVMDDLNVKLKDLRAEDYGVAISEITKALGGTHQRTIIENLIEGWDRYKDIVDVSLNSSGFSIQQNELIMQTFAKQMEVLKTTLSELAVAIGDAGLMDALKGLVGGATDAVSWFSSLDKSAKDTIITATELTLAFGALNMGVKKVFQVGILQAIFNITKAKTGIIDLTKAEEILNIKVEAQSISETDRSNVLKALNGNIAKTTLSEKERTIMLNAQTAATYKTTGATIALNVAISALLIAIPLIIGGIVSYNNSQKEMRQNSIDNIDTMKSELSEIDSLIAQYEELASKTNLTVEEKVKLESVSQRLVELLPNVKGKIDSETSSIEDNTRAFKENATAKRKELIQSSKDFLDANKSDYSKAKAKMQEFQSEFDFLTGEQNSTMPSNAIPAMSNGIALNQQQVAEYSAQQKAKLTKQYEEYKATVDEYEAEKAQYDMMSTQTPEVDNNSFFSGKYGKPTQTEYPFDPNDFKNTLSEIEHDYNMGKINDKEYASQLEQHLSKNRAGLEKTESIDDIWSLEEKIHGLRQDKKTTKKDGVNTLPEGLQNIYDSLEHKSSLDQISSIDYTKQLKAAMAKYKGQLSQKEIWALEEKIYSTQKQDKTDIKDIDYDTLKDDLNVINNEITSLEKQQEFIEVSGEKKSHLVNLLTSQTDKYNKKQIELNNLSDDYKLLLSDVNEQIEELNPSSYDYSKTLEELTKQKQKLTEEIRNNTSELIDNGLAVAKINAQMQDYIEESLKEVYAKQQIIAQQALDEKNETDILDLKNEIFNVTKDELDQYGLTSELLNDQQKAYEAITEEKKKAKQDEIDLLEEEIDLQKHLNDLNEIESEIDKVKKDTRFAYIDERTGKEVFTYDRNKVTELEKDKTQKISDYDQDQLKQKLQDELDVIQDEADKVKTTYDLKLNALQEFQTKEKEDFDIYWERRLSDETIQTEALQLIDKMGYKGSLELTEQYFNDLNTRYYNSQFEAYEGGKSITEGLSRGLFENLDSVLSAYTNQINGTGTNSQGRNSSNSDHKTLLNDALNNFEGTTTIEQQMEIIKAKKAQKIGTYHVGGFVGQPELKEHETVAKLLEGEYVISKPVLNKLSLALPQLSSNSYNNGDKKQNISETINRITISIDNVNANNIDDFMKSMQPYIESQK